MITGVFTDYPLGVATSSVMSLVTGLSVGSIPAATTELTAGTTYYRNHTDLSGRQFIKMSGFCTTNSLPGAPKIYVRYSVVGTDQTTLADAISTLVAFNPLVTSSTVCQVTTPWYPIPAGARRPVILAVCTIGGDAVNGFTIRSMSISYK